jgi:superfamily II DNA or RNA helicase
MRTTAAVSIDVELAEVEAAVGATSFKRGKTYARANRVHAAAWDEQTLLLKGRVLGNGAIYDTAVQFSRADNGLEFDEGECSCPIGWNCKHVAALVITAAPVGATARGSALPARDRPPGPSQSISDAEHRPTRNQAQAQPPPVSSWEQPLRAMIAAPTLSASGDPLAIELEVAFNSVGSSVGAPRLRARLMRPGARGGWVNGSLSWGSLESWDLRQANYREDHLALAREFQAVHQARLAASQRYYYAYGNRDRTLDLSDWDAAQLWSLLDQAAHLGMITIHAGGRLSEVPRYRRAELVLDVTATADGGRRLRPALATEGAGDLGDCAPLLFLGTGGHGLVLVKRTPGDATGGGTGGETATTAGDVSSRPLRLVRLARDTPVELQRMLLDGVELTVPAQDLARFATQLAPALRNVAPVVSSDASFTTPEVSAPELVLRAHHGSDHVTAVAWTWSYTVGDERAEFALDGISPAPGFRDVEAERAILDALDLRTSGGLADLGLLDGDGRPAADVAPLQGFDTVRFVTEALPALEQIEALTTDISGEPLDYRDADASLEIGISTAEIAGNHDWFDLDVAITVEGRELPFAQVFAAIARSEERMLLDDGAHFSLLAPELESLRRLIEEARSLGEGTRPDSLRISRYQAGLWEELVGLGVVREQAESWRRQVGGLLGLERLAEIAPPAGLEASLRPYQLEGFRWLASLWNLGLGGILADDMGLGKTIEALALICHTLEHAKTAAGPLAGGATKPFLVIAPTSVVPNWVSEAGRFTPGLTVRALTDTITRAGVSIEDVAADADIVVTTYTLARLDHTQYGSVEWGGVILDEAQAVKNRNAKTHAAVRRLRAPFKLAITGTPMENNLGELWALLSITAPGLFPDPAAFDEQYARPIERHRDAEQLARLRRRIRPLVKRRTKELVAADLPAKQEQILEVELHPRHRKLYDTHMQRERQRILGLLDDFDANRFTVLTAITRMRQLSLHAGLVDGKYLKVPSAKLDALAEQLTEVVDSGHRALVFSQFTGFLALVRERLDTEGIGHCYLDGRTRNREKVIAGFKQGEDPVFLISLKAGGFGLNLTEADYCFLLDPWWNPATETQAIDRTHRIGQTRQVMVYRLVSGDTIEQKVVALAARKAALFKGVMDDGDLFAGRITADDIRGLLS